MVEGDLLDLTLPSLLSALGMEGSTAVLRMQRGTDQGALYFCEGTLVHAASGAAVGDQAVYDLLAWPDGRFRLVRDAERHPRTITHPLSDFLAAAHRPRPAGPPDASAGAEPGEDECLLDELLALVTRLEQDRARLAEGRIENGGVPALLLVTAVVNSLIAFVTARTADPSLLPSRVLARLAEADPYTQVLGEEQERMTVATAAALLKSWQGAPEDRRRMFQDVCRALLDVLAIYCNTITTFFHTPRAREEWRATFDVFVDGLRSAVQQADV